MIRHKKLIPDGFQLNSASISHIYLTRIFNMHWLISVLVSKKFKKFGFRVNFLTMFLSIKNWPIEWNFGMFSPRIFVKLHKEIRNLRVGYLPEKNENSDEKISFWKFSFFFRENPLNLFFTDAFMFSGRYPTLKFCISSCNFSKMREQKY